MCIKRQTNLEVVHKNVMIHAGVRPEDVLSLLSLSPWSFVCWLESIHNMVKEINTSSELKVKNTTELFNHKTILKVSP